MKTIKTIICSLLLLVGGIAYAQNGLEGVVVEKYYVSNAADATGSIGALPAGSVTYRVFADLLPGYNFQALYGVSGHALSLNTTTSFFNNEDRGNTTPNGIASAYINDNSVAIDSWFSVGGAGGGQMGILKSEDNGATNLIAGNTMLLNNDASAGVTLATQDGLIAGTPVAVTFVGLSASDLNVFNNTSNVGNSFTTSNGSIAALGGSTGPIAATNKVLIGQFTTNGVFSFALNIQIGTPTGGTQNYVASAPTGSQISIPSLTFISTPPAPTVTSPINICVGSTPTALSVTPSAGCTLKWYTVATGGTATTTAPIPPTTLAATKYYYVSQVNGIGNESARSTITVVISPAAAMPGTITGPSTGVCVAGVSNPTYSIAAIAYATSYNWTVPTGMTITGGQGTTAITASVSASFAGGNVSVTLTNHCGTGAARVLYVKSILTAPTTLTGIYSGLCPAGVSSTNYTCGTVVGATSYTWTLPTGATITAGAGTNVVTVSFGPSFTYGNISAAATNACGSSAAKVLALKSILSAPTSLTGISSGLCPSGVASTTYTCGTVVGATGYSWVVPTGATVTAGQGTTSATVSFGASFVYGNISVYSTNGCGNSATAKSLAVKSVLSYPASITGITSGLCPSGVASTTYTCPAVAGATGYSWTAPAGATISAGQGTISVTIDFGASFSTGNITVASTNGCGNSAVKSLAVKSILTYPASITGTTGICANSTGNVYTCAAVAGATGYSWTVPAGATITAGQGTSSITVSFGASAGAITVKSVNGCGNSAIAKSLTTSITCMGLPENSSGSRAPLSMDNSGMANFNVYPVPASEYFNIDFAADADKDVLLVVYDVLGNKVIEQKHSVIAGENTIRTDFAKFNNGIYVVKLTDLVTNEIQTKTFVK